MWFWFNTIIWFRRLGNFFKLVHKFLVTKILHFYIMNKNKWIKIVYMLSSFFSVMTKISEMKLNYCWLFTISMNQNLWGFERFWMIHDWNRIRMLCGCNTMRLFHKNIWYFNRISNLISDSEFMKSKKYKGIIRLISCNFCWLDFFPLILCITWEIVISK